MEVVDHGSTFCFRIRSGRSPDPTGIPTGTPLNHHAPCTFIPRHHLLASQTHCKEALLRRFGHLDMLMPLPHPDCPPGGRQQPFSLTKVRLVQFGNHGWVRLQLGIVVYSKSTRDKMRLYVPQCW